MVSGSSLALPTEENLTPLLPSKVKRVGNPLKSLTQTTKSLESFNLMKFDVADQNDSIKNQSFSAYTPNPVTIKGFELSVKIMTSKQKPKIILIRGSDNKTYTFLLKYENGDVRKE